MDQETPEYEVFTFAKPDVIINHDTLTIRQAVLIDARMFVQPILDAYPPEDCRVTSGPTAPFTTPAGSTTTKAEQVVNLILTIADWLLDVQE